MLFEPPSVSLRRVVVYLLEGRRRLNSELSRVRTEFETRTRNEYSKQELFWRISRLFFLKFFLKFFTKQPLLESLRSRRWSERSCTRYSTHITVLETVRVGLLVSVANLQPEHRLKEGTRMFLGIGQTSESSLLFIFVPGALRAFLNLVDCWRWLSWQENGL